MQFLLIVVIYVVWMLISTAGKKSKTNNAGGGKPAAGRPAAPKAGKVPAAPRKKAEAGMQAWLDRNTQAPSQPAEPLKPAAAMSAAPAQPAVPAQSFSPVRPAPVYGSLGGEDTEGIDPCHDHYSDMSIGSLPQDSEEGKDPCHDGWEPAAPVLQTPAENGGSLPGLNWTGDELVKGFIYGEILKRRAG